MPKQLVVLLAGLGFLLNGCLADLSDSPFTPTPSPQPPTATTTIVWFPPSATPTRYATPVLSPTPDQSPIFGDLIYQSLFDDPGGWSVGTYPSGNIAVGANKLNIAISQPQTGLVSLLAGVVAGDFYLEATLTPNLCQANDEYGLSFWSVAESNQFRAALSCGGLYRIYRLENRNETLLQDWTPSAQVPRGAMLPVRIALWSGGGLLRLYINDILQTSLYTTPRSGGFGVYALAIVSPAVSVGFSDLEIFAVSRDLYLPTPTRTVIPSSTPYPTLPTP